MWETRSKSSVLRAFPISSSVLLGPLAYRNPQSIGPKLPLKTDFHYCIIMETWVLLVIILIVSIYFLRPRRPLPSIQSIFVYPVKSCAGIRLSQAKIVSTGLAYDRMWVFVDNEGHQVTAREDPRLWRVQPSLDLAGKAEPREMTLTYEGKSLTIDLTKPLGKAFTMTKFTTTAEVAETGTEASVWVREALGKDYRLCRVTKPQPSVASPDVLITLPDQEQVLFISNASLSALIRSAPEPKKAQLEMSCFRPNVVLEGCAAWAEDSWRTIRIGDLTFTDAGPCPRCIMTTIDPKTLAFDEKTEPLPTLRKIHGKGIKGFFGQWFSRSQDGTIHVGAPIQVLSTKTFPNE